MARHTSRVDLWEVTTCRLSMVSCVRLNQQASAGMTSEAMGSKAAEKLEKGNWAKEIGQEIGRSG